MSRPAVLGVRSLQIGVVDLDAATAFFSGVWGLAIVQRLPNATYLRGTGPDHHILGLHKRSRAEVLRVDLRCASSDNVHALYSRISQNSSAEAEQPSATREPGGVYGFSFRDPEGRLLSVIADDERHDDTADAPDRPRKLSHVVINSVDARGIEDFYIDELGFKLTDRTRRMAFIRCNSDHHSIAIVPTTIRTLHHIAFEMPSFDAVMRGIGRLREAGCELGWGIGRHGPGNNIFAYFVGTERIPIEYTAEVQQVDDSYQTGGPDDWKPPPGRMDQWGAANGPTSAMRDSETRLAFAAESFRLSR
jgi:catechol-2,3-dioxygenase